MSKYAFFKAKQCGLPETESQQGRIFDEACRVLLYIRVLRRARKPSRVAGTAIAGKERGTADICVLERARVGRGIRIFCPGY